MTVVKDRANKEYVYFIYSSTQEQMRTEIESRVNKKFIPGEINIHGEWKKFTQISKTPNLTMFADSVVIFAGFKEDATYHDCSNSWKIGV